MKKSRVLVLGCGNSRKQVIRVGLNEEHLATMGPNFEDNFDEVCTIDVDPEANPTILWDLTKTPWPVPREHFDEVHAYEVLEHLTPQGDYEAFFSLWKEIWYCLRPTGIVCATTPWWESLWVWQDPGHKMCYSAGLLTYLSQEEYEKQVGHTPMTDYRRIWSKPFDFQGRMSQMSGEDPMWAGYQFVLQKMGRLREGQD